jgi:hypothetical protein
MPALGAGAQEIDEAMLKKDEIVLLSSDRLDRTKPMLLLLHGATEDPMEMADIAKEWEGNYNVLLYAHNFHEPIKVIASHLAREMKSLRKKIDGADAEGHILEMPTNDKRTPLPSPLPSERGEGERCRGQDEPDARGCAIQNLTVITYSYSAAIFRAAVIFEDDRTLFSGASLIQLVPTAGGSHLARSLINPLAAWLTGLASEPSIVENPYGKIARQLWDGAGNQKFCEVINPARVKTILIEGDQHSLAHTRNRAILRRYNNGIGTNVVVIPKSEGVTHDYFPGDPVARQYLRQVLEAKGAEAYTSQNPVARSAGLGVGNFGGREISAGQ